MTVTREEVRWAYRLLLGREPENEAAIAAQLTAPSLADLRAHFMASAEFGRLVNTGVQIGRFLDVTEDPVEVQCSSADLQRMMDRVAREWVGFGERDPHWSVLVSEQFASVNFAAHEEEFFASGDVDVAQLMQMVIRNRPNFTPRNVLDFGCGVGRLSMAFAKRADHVLGLDISPPHLSWAQVRADKVGASNVTFRCVTSPEMLDDIKDIDLLATLIVLQHNPPPVMAELLSKLLKTLRVGGLGIFQIPTYLRDQPFSVSEYLRDEQLCMEVHALPQSEVFRVVNEAGCVPLEVREDGRMGNAAGLSHLFLVERRA